MDLNNKLKGIPHIYYFNLDNRTDRREWMENQFKYWGIENYTRISGTKYLASKYKDWCDIHIQNSLFTINPPLIANLITHLEAIKNWLENTNEEYLILLEDDASLEFIKYWHFDWEYLMNNIPYDWDCIQLGFVSLKYYHFFLHPKTRHSYYGPCMINRYYAQKLVKLHFDNGLYKIFNKVADLDFINKNCPNFFSQSATVDYAITHPGRTYCIPLLSVNANFASFENYVKIDRPEFYILHKININWWKNERDKFTLRDFFIYGKPYDHLMTKYINYPGIMGIYANEELILNEYHKK
jgi:hypothetical protein